VIDPRWLAGFFDGEGTCYIEARRGKGGSGKYVWRLSPCITITQSDREVLERIRNHFGFGHIVKCRSGFTGKPMYHYVVERKEHIRRFIEEIKEHAVLKRRALELMEAFVKLKEGREPWGGWRLAEGVKLAREITSLCSKVRPATFEKLDRLMEEAAKLQEQEEASGRPKRVPDGQSYKEWTEEELEFLRANYYKMSLREIARALGRTKGSVCAKASRVGITRGKP